MTQALSLREAIEQDRLEVFISENKALKGCAPRFNATLKAMVGSSQSTHQTSSEDDCDD